MAARIAAAQDARTTPGRTSAIESPDRRLSKVPTGIKGLDEITYGGLPKGRATLLCGSAGSGKTLMAMEFIVNGARDQAEPGVFLAFEESAQELTTNVASLGFDLLALQERGLLALDHVELDASLIDETGDYDLDGLFIRLAHNIDRIGAKRVVIDTIEVLFSTLRDTALLRNEFRRLLTWLKGRGLTVVITSEQGEGRLTRHGIEEYVSDCVIKLDHRVREQISTRRLRVVKYRGSLHGADEHPFLISSTGVSVLPITTPGLDYPASVELVSSGVPALDTMLGGGVYRGSSVLLSGDSGTGKTTLAMHFIDEACRRGERALYVSFEESAAQLTRDMSPVGFDLSSWVDQGRLRFLCARPSSAGIEQHLAMLQHEVAEFHPSTVVIDPISAMGPIGDQRESTALWSRVIDFLKSAGVTTCFTSLVQGGAAHTEQNVSSVIDTWLLIKTLEGDGERNRVMYVLKSRGVAHSNQIREFLITDHGVQLIDVYIGDQGVLTGSARAAQETRERITEVRRRHDVEHRRRELRLRQEETERRIAALRTELDSDARELDRLHAEEAEFEAVRAQARVDQERLRHIAADEEPPPAKKGRSPSAGASHRPRRSP